MTFFAHTQLFEPTTKEFSPVWPSTGETEAVSRPVTGSFSPVAVHFSLSPTILSTPNAPAPLPLTLLL